MKKSFVVLFFSHMKQTGRKVCKNAVTNNDAVRHHAFIGHDEADRLELFSEFFNLAVQEYQVKMGGGGFFAAGN